MRQIILSTTLSAVLAWPLAAQEVPQITTTAELQSALAACGYYAGSIDGRMGPGTRQALAEAARDGGFDLSGGLTAEALRWISLSAVMCQSDEGWCESC